MLNPSYSNQFGRDLKKMLKQGKNGDKNQDSHGQPNK